VISEEEFNSVESSDDIALGIAVPTKEELEESERAI